tara:strand:+ start:597 stop:1397 length:801 start_codon:yes stop_codon:yes gene_type:complete
MSSSEEKNNQTNTGEDQSMLIQEINRLTAETRMWRIGSVVAVLLIIALFILSIVNHVRGEFPTDAAGAQEFFNKLHEDAKVSVIPGAKKLVKDTFADSQKEIERQLKLLWQNQGSDVVKIAAEELDLLVSTVPDKGIETLNQILYESLGEKLEAVETPQGTIGELESGELVEAIQKGVYTSSTNRTGDIIAVMFKPHIDELSSMSNHLNTIYDKEYGSLQSREREFTISMALTLMERVNIQLREAEEALKAQQEADQIKQNEQQNN